MKIEENNLWYNLIYDYTMLRLPTAFAQMKVVGEERIPKHGALILAPNHSNAFMDALLMLKVLRRSAVFVARADMFRNKRMAEVLAFFKIMPIMRMKDGRDNVKKNEEIIARSVEVIRSGMPFVIFPEGTDRGKRALLPLGKGVCRIAFQTMDALKGQMPVYVLPVGVEYGDWNHYRRSLSVEIGHAVCVDDFVKEHEGEERQDLMNMLRIELRERMSRLFSCLSDDAEYQCSLDYCNLRLASENIERNNPYRVAKKRQDEMHALGRMKREEPQAYEEQLSLMRRFSALCRQHRIEETTLQRLPSWISVVCRLPLLAALSPLVALLAIVGSPVMVAAAVVNGFMPKNYPEIRNSIRLLVDLVMLPLVYVAVFVCLFSFLPWFLALGGVLLLLLKSPVSVAHDYVYAWRRLCSDVRFLSCAEMKSLAIELLKRQ